MMEAATVKLARARGVVVVEAVAVVIKLAAATIVQSHNSPIATTRIKHRTLRGTAVPALMVISYGREI
jgi:hypothetical protein